MLQRLVTIGFVAQLTSMGLACVNQTEPLDSGNPPCDALETAGLRHLLLYPMDCEYEPQIQTWWAANTRLRPWCLVLPQTTDEVSLILRTLYSAGEGAGDWHIAIRSGGHATSGSNNIVNGVTIDLSHMNSVDYDADSNTARIHPGARWGNVYAELYEQGVTVVGGRDGAVGVGGFLLGGGYSFYSPKLGFGCDSIVNYEIVLANGTIVDVSENAHPDLFRALKGGGSNFGLVTRFDMEAMPSQDLFYELRSMSSNYSDVVVNAVVDFANHDPSLGDNALLAWVAHNTSMSQDITVSTIYVNVMGDSSIVTGYSQLRDLPALSNLSTRQSIVKAAETFDIGTGMWNSGATGTFKNNPAILRHCVQLHEQFVQALTDAIGADQFSTFMFFQPLPSYLGRLGQQHGGNILGLEDTDDNGIIWTSSVSVTTGEADFALARSHMMAISAQIKSFAASVDGDADFIYLNYADANQNPLGSYGNEQVRHMRNVAAKYDPMGMFQKRIPRGFKISRVV